MKSLIISLRPAQWIKNTFVIAPLIFSQYLFDLNKLSKSITAFFLFCFISGAVYLINDIADMKKDKMHPEKSKRPLASGKLKIRSAISAASILAIGTNLISFYINIWFGLVILCYLLLNLFYSFLLKNIVILDVMAISLGFLLRVLGGTVAINIVPTSWLLICSALLSLFIAFSKRRHELVLLEQLSNNHRQVLVHYSQNYLDQMISAVTASTLISYILYTISDDTVGRLGSKKLLLTVPFVIYGIFRYLYLVHKKGLGGSPAQALFNDIPLLVNVFLWAVSSGILIYFL